MCHYDIYAKFISITKVLKAEQEADRIGPARNGDDHGIAAERQFQQPPFSDQISNEFVHSYARGAAITGLFCR